MKNKFLKTLCLALAAAAFMPAASFAQKGLQIVVKTAESLEKVTQEGTNAVPAFFKAGQEINAATSLSNVNRVAKAVKQTNGEMKLKAGAFDRTVGGKQAVKYAAANNSADVVIKSPAENPYNLVPLAKPSEIEPFTQGLITNAVTVILPVGYSAAPAGYEEPTRKFLESLANLMTRTNHELAFITSPTADKGSIDAITTMVSQKNYCDLTYITAQDYVPYINPANFPEGIDINQYLAAPKYVLPTAQAYSEASAKSSNVLLVTGGRNQSVLDFVNAIKTNNEVIIVDNPAPGPAWDGAKNRVGNASQYLIEQIKAFRAGRPLPHPDMEGLNLQFLKAHESFIRQYVVRTTPDDIGAQAAFSFINRSGADFLPAFGW